MLRFLFAHRSGFGPTNAILVKLIRLFLGTGLLTSTVTILDMVLFIVFQNVGYYLILARMLSKLYSNSMMVLLNSRASNGRDIGYYSSEPGNLSWAVEPDPIHQTQQTSSTYRLTDLSAPGRSTTTSVPIQMRVMRDTISKSLTTVSDLDHPAATPRTSSGPKIYDSIRASP
ncbi:hypothetical protein PM082_017973 [Marasmius tenuissimus]|nr:hypothetical protein PM082_017973 [Marasmius tenuissimus]